MQQHTRLPTVRAAEERCAHLISCAQEGVQLCAVSDCACGMLERVGSAESALAICVMLFSHNLNSANQPQNANVLTKTHGALFPLQCKFFSIVMLAL